MQFKNDLLLRTIRGERVERPPVWLMRQAGRILPQYRDLRARLSGFKDLVQQPSLAAEATVQPIDELGVDAAILFSDILVIPEAMGLDYKLVEKKGPLFPRTIQSTQDVQDLLAGVKAASRLDYVYEAIHHTLQRLDGEVPLIGFSGAPWTLLSYMVEGSGSKTFSRAKKFLYTHPEDAHTLLEKITETVIEYLKLKIAAGVHVVQLFDSWAGILSPAQYRTFSLPYLTRICEAISEAPVTVFAKGAWFVLEDFNQLDCQVIGLDWNMEPFKVRQLIHGRYILQGNLDPCNLYAPAGKVEDSTLLMLQQFGRGHIANLGHGVYPDTPLVNVKTFVNTVKNYRY